MEEAPPPSVVVKFRLTRELATRRVRALAASSKNLHWTQHIRHRMKERGIDSDVVLRVLRDGDCDVDPVEGKATGEWKIKLIRRMASGRVVGVVTIVVGESYLRLVTAEWEDVR